MIVRADGRTHCGSVADLRDTGIEGPSVAAAIRGEESPCRVHCPAPGPLFERVGHVRPGMALRTRTALAEAARSRGLTAPQADEIERLRAERTAITVEGEPQRRSAAHDADPQALRERVAELRGRVQVLEDCDRDASEERAELREAAGRLSEIETTRLAAEQYRTQTRDERDRRDRRMRLDDRIANLEREARSQLAAQVREPYERAVFALDPTADPRDAPPVVAALAILRIASIRAPIVLAIDHFSTPAAAADWIGGQVVRCDPDPDV